MIIYCDECDGIGWGHYYGWRCKNCSGSGMIYKVDKKKVNGNSSKHRKAGKERRVE